MTQTKFFSLSRRKRYASELRDQLTNAREIHEALPESRPRNLLRPFVMLRLFDRFTVNDSGIGIPQPELREALLACEDAYQGKRAIKRVVREVSELMAEHLPDDDEAGDHLHVILGDD